MNPQKMRYALRTLCLVLLGLSVIVSHIQTPIHAASHITYSYSLSPVAVTPSTTRVTLRITGLMGEEPPSSTWYGPGGEEVNPGCKTGQTIRQPFYESGSLYEVRDYFYVSACSRSPGAYTVEVGTDSAGSFSIWSAIYLPLVLTPPGPPGAFSKVSPPDGASEQRPLSTVLDWEDSGGAESYVYCYDTTDDDACAAWVDASTESQVELDDLSENTTYYWQVRATNDLGTTYADGASAAYWSFTTGEAITETWTMMTGAAGWPARSNHASVALSNGTIVVMGGYDGDDHLNDVWHSTDQGATWTQLTAAAEWSARTGPTSVALPDDSIVLMGGGTPPTSDVWRSTDGGATWTQLTAAAPWSARSGAASVVLSDGSIVLVGGPTGDTSDVWRSTDQGATWTQLTAAASWSARRSHTCVALSDDSIVLMGGYDGSYYNDVWRSTDQGVTWTQLTAAAPWSARDDHTSVVLSDDSIVLMGGGDPPTSEVWRSTDRGATWAERLPAAPWSARSSAASVTLPDGSIVLMGGYDGSDYLHDVWRFGQIQ